MTSEFLLAQDAIAIDIELAEELGLAGGIHSGRAALVDLGIGGFAGDTADTGGACAAACSGLSCRCEGKAKQCRKSCKFGLHDE